MSEYVSAIATSVPQYRAHRHSVIDRFAQSAGTPPELYRKLKVLYRASGIDYRHSVLPDFTEENMELFSISEKGWDNPDTQNRMRMYKKYALGLALQSVHKSIKLSTITSEAITHVISISCTGMYAPGMETEIIKALGLKNTTERHAVQFMGCHASFQGLKIAKAISISKPDAVILLVSTELCTLHYKTTHKEDQLLANALFSDGSAAALISSRPLSDSYLELGKLGSVLVSRGEKDMSWEIGNNGFDMRLSQYVPDILSDAVAQMLDAASLKPEAYDAFAIHPGGKKILTHLESVMNIPRELNASGHYVLRNYGNMSSATIWFVLDHLIKNTEKEHSKLLSMAFGPGLTLEHADLILHRNGLA